MMKAINNHAEDTGVFSKHCSPVHMKGKDYGFNVPDHGDEIHPFSTVKHIVKLWWSDELFIKWA